MLALCLEWLSQKQYLVGETLYRESIAEDDDSNTS